MLRVGPQHPLYHKKDAVPRDFADSPFVDYTYRIFQEYPALSRILPINRRRLILVNDRQTKQRLVSRGPFITMGCQLPADLNEHYGFRNIPLGDIHYVLFLLEREQQQRSLLVQQYIHFLEEQLKTI